MEWELDQMDVATTFMYAKLEEGTYVDITEGVVLVRGEGRVWKLRKCLYDLKQSPMSLVRSLMYLVVCTRFGLAMVVFAHGWFCGNPQLEH